MSSKQKPQEDKEVPVITAASYADGFLKSKENKDFHYNFVEESEDYLVSSGSLIFDDKLGGGIGRGVHKFCGVNEGGKTAQSLLFMKNMLDTVKGSMGLYIKSEGRLSKEAIARSGLTFVSDPAQWVEGTCFVFETNVYDTIFDFLRGLIKHNPNKTKFCIIIDCMDALVPKSELEKSTTDAAKVAAGAVMTSDFLKRVSLAMHKFGHLCILISQVRSKISIDMYAKQDGNNKTSGSGSNASQHYPDWILEFQRHYKSDKIMDDPEAQIGPNNKVYGHNAKVLICKSTNETTDQTVKYPIRYGRTGGKSIWVEREIVEMLLMWEFLTKKASWFSFDEEVNAFLESNNLSVKQPIQGMKAIYSLLEENNELTACLAKFTKENCIK